jgi:hypothetical protein
MRHLTRVLLALLAVVALTAACGGDDGDEVVASGDGSADSTTTTVDPDTGVSLPVTDDGSTATTWARIEPTDDLVDPVVATPDEIVPDPDDPNAVLVHFYGGVQDCYGARATVVSQGADQVEIRVETGGQPDAGDTACIEVAEAQELVVTLDAPVADRELVAVTT